MQSSRKKFWQEKFYLIRTVFNVELENYERRSGLMKFSFHEFFKRKIAQELIFDAHPLYVLRIAYCNFWRVHPSIRPWKWFHHRWQHAKLIRENYKYFFVQWRKDEVGVLSHFEGMKNSMRKWVRREGNGRKKGLGEKKKRRNALPQRRRRLQLQCLNFMRKVKFLLRVPRVVKSLLRHLPSPFYSTLHSFYPYSWKTFF